MVISRRRVRTILGALCLVAALWPGYRMRLGLGVGGATITRTTIRLGLAISPLLTFERTWDETPTGRDGRMLASFRQSSSVELLSLSFGLLVVGMVLVTWRHRPRAAPPSV